MTVDIWLFPQSLTQEMQGFTLYSSFPTKKKKKEDKAPTIPSQILFSIESEQSQLFCFLAILLRWEGRLTLCLLTWGKKLFQVSFGKTHCSKSQVGFVPASTHLSKVEQRAAVGNDEKLCLIQTTLASFQAASCFLREFYGLSLTITGQNGWQSCFQPAMYVINTLRSTFMLCHRAYLFPA